jgi:hypothetical protein
MTIVEASVRNDENGTVGREKRRRSEQARFFGAVEIDCSGAVEARFATRRRSPIGRCARHCAHLFEVGGTLTRNGEGKPTHAAIRCSRPPVREVEVGWRP